MLSYYLYFSILTTYCFKAHTFRLTFLLSFFLFTLTIISLIIIERIFVITSIQQHGQSEYPEI
jgi:hypothetical protein